MPAKHPAAFICLIEEGHDFREAMKYLQHTWDELIDTKDELINTKQRLAEAERLLLNIAEASRRTHDHTAWFNDLAAILEWQDKRATDSADDPQHCPKCGYFTWRGAKCACASTVSEVPNGHK